MIQWLATTVTFTKRYLDGRGGTRIGTVNGEAGASREGSRGRGEKVVRWSWMCLSTGKPTRGMVPIRFSTYNICNGRNGGLKLGVKGDVPGQHGPGHLSRNTIDGWYIHPRVGWV